MLSAKELRKRCPVWSCNLPKSQQVFLSLNSIWSFRKAYLNSVIVISDEVKWLNINVSSTSQKIQLVASRIDSRIVRVDKHRNTLTWFILSPTQLSLANIRANLDSWTLQIQQYQGIFGVIVAVAPCGIFILPNDGILRTRMIQRWSFVGMQFNLQ